MKIIFESHSTTVDNERHISSGWFDVELSPLGRTQALALGEHYQNMHLDAIFCSDLQRSYKTAEIAFPGRKIIKDKRLRECHYGDLTRHPAERINQIKDLHIDIPFPNGESYQDVVIKMEGFLQEIKEEYQTVLVIGHRATQYALEHIVNKQPLQSTLVAPWQWQRGWIYQLKD